MYASQVILLNEHQITKLLDQSPIPSNITAGGGLICLMNAPYIIQANRGEKRERQGRHVWLPTHFQSKL